MSTDGETVYAVMDVETSGLSAQADALLSVACRMLDENFQPLDEVFYHVIRYGPMETKFLRDNADQYVRNMHDANGLWEKLPAGTPLDEVSTALLAHMKRHAPNARQAMLVGNSPRLDLNFLEEHLPQVYAHLHYRFIDVTTLEHMAMKLYGVDAFKKASTHDAMADVNTCMQQLYWVLGVLDPAF